MTLPCSVAVSLPTIRSVLAAITLILAPVTSIAAEWNIDQLMRDLAQIHSSHARFVETKYIAMLERPLESSGELFYTAPGHLEKQTLKPKSESMILDQGTLVIMRGRRKKHIQLQDFPELGAFIESIRGTLAGDRQALELNYQLCLEGTAQHWILQLLPLEVEEKMQAVVQKIRIAGTGTTISSVEIKQADGDSSLMLIEQLPAP